MARRSFDIGIVIPLPEEFRYVKEIAPQLEAISHEGTYFYRLDYGPNSVIVSISGRMGTLPALQATNRLLAFADVRLLVVLGLGGALDNDVSVGDVVIAEEVDEFQANSKAEANGDTYAVKYSGRHWRLEFAIQEAIANFEFVGSDAFSLWQAEAAKDFHELSIPKKEEVCSEQPSLHLGPIASGNIVAASTAFGEELKSVNRKFAAIDMEAAGVASAASERVHPIPCLVVRGMSDHANEAKEKLDKQGNRAWRRYCVRNAASFLKHLFAWPDFREACGLSSVRSISLGDLAAELASNLGHCIGGAWLVGVAFGLYSYGPHVTNDASAVPMDVSRLRVLDGRAGILIEAAEKAKQALMVSRDVAGTTAAFTALVDEYREELQSDSADVLLADFDGVVLATLCPEQPDQNIESMMMEADRLEEEVGSEAVVELLGELNGVMPPLRERFIEALASLERWPEIIDTAEPIPPEDLSRSELENLTFAYAETANFIKAKDILAVHTSRYTDNAAHLFRRHLAIQNPALRVESDGTHI
ncbi:MAG: hypothetical protein Fues2KO_46760 [Fuerstiella sp.]